MGQSLYNLIVGNDFEIEAFEVKDVEDVAKLSEISERQSYQRTQKRLTYLIFGTIVVALLIAVGVGFYDASFNEVNSVWSAAALPLGYVLKAYFDKPASQAVSKIMNDTRKKVK